MHKLSEKAVKDFQSLVKKKRGIDLSDEEAQAMALDWLQFFKLVYEPMQKESKIKQKTNQN